MPMCFSASLTGQMPQAFGLVVKAKELGDDHWSFHLAIFIDPSPPSASLQVPKKPSMPTLTIQLPGQPPVSHVLKDETITIGRLKGNTIVIEDSSISLMHAKITRKDGQFFLKDLNSTNGTIVNGQPVGEVKLCDLDRVRFAEITCQFLADA